MFRLCLRILSLSGVTIYILLCFTIPFSSSFFVPSTTIQRPKETYQRKRMELYFFNIFGNDNKNDNNNKIISEQQSSKTKTTKPKDDDKKQQQIDDQKDPVEKLFSFFFGEPEQEPFGLKRFGAKRFPEQYPATVDEWAEPVVGDTKDIAFIRPLLKNTNLEYRLLTCTYDANKDGWNAQKFHEKVDKKGGAIVVCRTNNGFICGGYNPKGWVGYGEARGSIAAFLFRQDRSSSSGWKKLRKVGGASMAQIDQPESGVMFGADSLIISLNNKANPKMARSKLGSYYERLPDGTNTLFDNKQPAVQLVDLKVYHGVYEPGEYIPFTDAEPFALY